MQFFDHTKQAIAPVGARHSRIFRSNRNATYAVPLLPCRTLAVKLAPATRWDGRDRWFIQVLLYLLEVQLPLAQAVQVFVREL